MRPDGFPGSLSALQRDLLEQLGRSGGEGFFLTGGSALVGFHGLRRETRDLDLFTRDPAVFEEGPARLAEVARAVGAVVEPLRTHPAFRRFRVVRPGEETLVDLVLEPVPAVFEPEPLPGWVLALDTPEEIAVNKVCALVGRGEPRDLVDLEFLAQGGVDLDQAVELARRKDGGVGPDTLLLVLPGVPSESEFRDLWMRRLRMGLLPPENP